MSLKQKIVIIDAGSGYIKAGFANQLFPLYNEHCISASKAHNSPSDQQEKLKQTHMTLYCNDALNWKQSDPEVEIYSPCNKIISQNNFSNDIFPIWSHAIKKLNINPQEYFLLMGTSSTINDNSISRKMKWAFEIQKFKAFTLVHDALAALISYNIIEGMVIDIGESSTRLFAVDEVNGVVTTNNVYTDLSGNIATIYFREILKCLHHPSFVLDNSIVEMIKKDKIKTRLIDKTENNFDSQTIEIPFLNNSGKSVLKLSKELYMVSEIFFDTYMLSCFMPGLALTLNMNSITNMVLKFIKNCNYDNRRRYLSNIVVVGGTCNCDSFLHRLKQQFDLILESHYKMYLKIINLTENNPNDYDIRIFQGLSLISSNIKPEAWIYKDDYFLSSLNKLSNFAQKTSLTLKNLF